MSRPSIELLFLARGDGNYLPLLEEIMRQGKEVYVAALSSGLAQSLRSSVDDFLDFGHYLFQAATARAGSDRGAKGHAPRQAEVNPHKDGPNQRLFSSSVCS